MSLTKIPPHIEPQLRKEAEETGVPYVTLLQLWIFKEIKKRTDQAGMET